MKVWEITFEFSQQVQAQLALAAETEEAAKAGVVALLQAKNPDLEIIKIRDMTNELDKQEQKETLN